MSTPNQLCTFHAAGLFFGLDVLSVQEVIRSPELAKIPLAPATISGLLNLRGQILTAIDLRRLLGLPESRPRPATAMLMILRTKNGQVALIVDAVGDVVDLNETSFEPPPDTVPATVRTFLTGVHKLDHQILHLLDSETTGSLLTATPTAA